MFHFQTLDVYKCAVAFLPLGIAENQALLIRIVSMLTKMIAKA